MTKPTTTYRRRNLEQSLEEGCKFQQLIQEQLALLDSWQRFQKKFSIEFQKNAAALAKLNQN